MTYLELFYEFFKTGLFAVGGGLATLPFLTDTGARTGWFTEEELANMVAVSESTPGPVGINMATYVGFTTGGIWGSIVATLGEITPSLIIILLVAYLLKSYRSNRFVDGAMQVLRPASLAMITAAMVDLDLHAFFNDHLSLSYINWQAISLFFFVFILVRYVPFTKKLHPISFILFSALIGVILKF